MGWQDVVWTMVLVAPCAGVVAIAVLALLHEDVPLGRRLGLVQRRQAVRRAHSELLASYLADSLEPASPPAVPPAAMVRRASPELLQEHLAERRKVLRPFRRRARAQPRSRATGPTRLVPFSV
jgi:hypothetical protein